MSFVDGVASLIDWSPNRLKYNHDKNEEEADKNSLYSDWVVIGNDLRKAIKKYEHSRQ